MGGKQFKILIIILMLVTSIFFAGYILRYYQHASSLDQEKKLEDTLLFYNQEKSNLQNKIKVTENSIEVENGDILDLQTKISQREQSVSSLKDQINDYEKLKKYDMTVFITPDSENIKSFANEIITSDPVQIYKFVRDEIKYVEDYLTYDYRFEYWQFPEETLRLRTGDCEDQAILLCTLFRAKGYGPDDVKVVFGLTSANTGHAWVELFYEGNWVVFDPTSSANEYIEKTRYYSLINANYKGSFNDLYYEVID
ncbi:MAG: Transglutaminase-like superfamily protein [Candidatus Methanofastidiosum methylothiophilum]|uniref:Transglutaminase-like superfamily protein n=1 Tax=Candidatus Methanofastidiosum methylothiophilum TaxID=1705564 RepID=A0A150J3P6_9EURY|nr:MAG: Transglutaminase-like superfamily protein [Candidatus Methanofastidiosum methylthiophilus]